MLRKWIAPMASLALLAGLSVPAVRAADEPAKPAGKATISVKVVDADGKAVDGATVQLIDGAGRRAGRGNRGGGGANTPPKPDANPMAADPKPADNGGGGGPGAGGARQRPAPLQSTTTDADGAATFKDVADGTYAVAARQKKGGNGRGTVTVAGGKDASVTVTLKARKAPAAP